MTKTSVRIAALAAMIHVLAHTAPAQTPLGTAFTYQGQLNQAGQPFNGPADLLFDLYDADVGGNLLGSQTLNGVAVSAGLFTVPLNGAGEFGASAFDGEARWLEVSVNGTPLAPRQEFTASPYALFAARPWVTDGANISYSAGRVGVGTTTPTARLHAIGSGIDGLSGEVSGGSARSGVYGHTNTGDCFGVFGRNDALTPYQTYGWAGGPTTGAYGALLNSSTGTFAEGYLGGDDKGVYGKAANATGVNYGVWGESASSSGFGVYGRASAASGFAFGVYGQSDSTSGRGVWGSASATNGITYGVYGQSASPSGCGVLGESVDNVGVRGNATGTTGVNYGVYGLSTSSSGRGVLGYASAASGTTYGGRFESDSTSGLGVYGAATAATGVTYGVYGQNDSISGYAVFGYATAGTGVTRALYGQSDSTSGLGVSGLASASSGTTFGGRFESDSTSGLGAYGYAGASSGANYGVFGQSNSTSGRGVYGVATATSGTTYAVRGLNSNTSGYAVYAAGDLGCSGNKAFVIDHPLDPANKYLKHYCCEGPEPINAYRGTAITDGQGEAWVTLPDYFAEINKDPSYQLTVVDDTDGDDFVQAKVARKIENNRFKIRTSRPNVEVCWEVKAVRNDLWVRAHGAPVEVEKQDLERGMYQHPELYGQPPEMGMDYDAERERQSLPPLPDQEASASDVPGRD